MTHDRGTEFSKKKSASRISNGGENDQFTMNANKCKRFILFMKQTINSMCFVENMRFYFRLFRKISIQIVSPGGQNRDSNFAVQKV